MDINKWCEVVLRKASSNIRTGVVRELESYIGRGIGRSSIAFYGGMNKGFEILKLELREVAGKLSDLRKMNNNQWEEVQNIFYKFIDKELKAIYDSCSLAYKEDLDLKKYEDEVNAEVDLIIEVQKQIIHERQRKATFEIIKMLFSAVLGGLIGAWAKTLL